MSSGPTLERLLELYREVLEEMKRCNPAPGTLEEIIKNHIRQLACEGCHGRPLYSSGGKCPKNWIDCGNYCVPAEVGCGESSNAEPASPVQH